MLSKSELWKMVEPVVREVGMYLFDLEMPGASRGTLRVFISPTANGSHVEGQEITVDHCADVSRRLSALAGFEELLPDHTVLEVSSPGVNRRLRRPEHFEGAVGERIKLKVLSGDNKSAVHLGTLVSFDGEYLDVKKESADDALRLPLGDVQEAHVDFLFQ